MTQEEMKQEILNLKTKIQLIGAKIDVLGIVLDGVETNLSKASKITDALRKLVDGE
jgi:hypothetical protein